MKVGVSLASHKLLMKSAKKHEAKQTLSDGYSTKQTSNGDNISYLVTRQTQETKKNPLVLSQDALTFMSWWRAFSVPGIWRFLEAAVTTDRFESACSLNASICSLPETPHLQRLRHKLTPKLMIDTFN